MNSAYRIAIASIALLGTAMPAVAQEVREIVVDATSDADFARVNLANGEVQPPDAHTDGNWQLGIKRYTLQLRDGVTAVLLLDNTMRAALDPGSVTSAELLEQFRNVSRNDVPPADQFGTALPSSIAVEDSPPFLYGIDPGNPHGVLPSHNIYLIRDGDTIYKVQFLSYYHPVSVEARVVTVRAAEVRSEK